MAIRPCTGILIRLTDHTEEELVEKVRGLSHWETFYGARNFFIGKEEEITNYRRPRSGPNHDLLLSKSKKALRNELKEPYLKQITEAIDRYVRKHRLYKEELNLTTVVTDIRLYGKEESRQVMLQPRGWVACRLDVVKEVRKVVAKIPSHIPKSMNLGSKIEAGSSGLTWNMADVVSVPERLSLGEGFTLPANGYKFFLGVEEPRRVLEETREIGRSIPSSCGLLCCIEVLQGRHRQLARVCRIGGVIEILDQKGSNKLVAVTVAHGLSDYVLSATSRKKVNGHKRGFRKKGTEKSWTSESIVEEAPQGVFSNTDWTPITGFHAINWLGNVWSPTPQHSSSVSVSNLAHLTADADFALLDLPFIPQNLFLAGTGVQHIAGLVMDNDLSLVSEMNQELHVIIEPDRVLQATLLSETPFMFVRGRQFTTRMIRLKLNKPLPRGTSGCWVVNGNNLCGVIVASNDMEPIAHMVTAEKVFSDIEKTIGHWPKIQIGEDQPALKPVQAEITKAGSAEVDKSHDEPSFIPQIRVEHPSRSSSPTAWGTVPRESPHGFEDRLFSSMVESAGEGNEGQFVPQNALETLITYSSVFNYLTGRLQTDVGDRIPGLVEYVIQSARKLFAILVLTDACEVLENMRAEELSDDDLPFHTDRRYLYRRGTDITSETDPELRLKSFEDVSRHKIISFDRQQWAMLAPQFNLNRDGESLFYRLNGKVVLPWVASDRVMETGRSTIRRIRIHPAHFDFSRVSSAKEFAIKELRSLTEEEFHQEISALIKLPRHRHLNTLLTSYAWQKSHFLVFPWADGNLFDLWTGNIPQPIATSDMVFWFLEQCVGLAEGLTIIHGTSKLSKKVFGRHGDIKPQNILWFRRSEFEEQGQSGMGVLKISDFGETKFHHVSTDKRAETTNAAVTITYSAPEFEAQRGGPVSRAFDIWSLGCVYLEFATWLLRGAKGVDEFGMKRLSKSRGNFETDTFYEMVPMEGPLADNTHGHGRLQAVVKASVTECVRSLQNDLNPPLSRKHSVLDDFLGLVLDKMLVVESKRAKSLEVLDTLQSLFRQLRYGKAETPLPPISINEPTKEPVQEAKSSSIMQPVEDGDKDSLKDVSDSPAQDTVQLHAQGPAPFEPKGTAQSTSRRERGSSPISGRAMQILSLEQIEEEIEEGERETDASGRVRETWRRKTRRTAGLGYASLHQSAKASYPSASRVVDPETSDFTSMSSIQLLEAERALLGQLMAIKEVQIQREGQAGADTAMKAPSTPTPKDREDSKMSVSVSRRWKLLNKNAEIRTPKNGGYTPKFC